MPKTFKDTCKLLTRVTIKDDMGVSQSTFTEQEVFCNILSIGGNDFNTSLQNNIKLEAKVEIRADLYLGQNYIELTQFQVTKRYKVERTYKSSNDFIELYLSTQLNDLENN